MRNDKRNRPVCLVHCMQKIYDHQRHKGEGIVQHFGQVKEKIPVLVHHCQCHTHQQKKPMK